MTKTYLPGLFLCAFLVMAMAVTPQLSISGPPGGTAIAAASVDPLSPAFVNPYIEKDLLDGQPEALSIDEERAYATLEVEPQTAGEPFPIVRTRFREPASPAGPLDVLEVDESLPASGQPPG